MLVWILLVCSLAVGSILSEGCTLHFNKDKPVVFLQKFGGNNLILDSDRGYISIPEGGSVQGFCNSGFQYPLGFATYTSSEVSTNETFACENDQIYYRANPNQLKFNAKPLLSCYDNNAAFYEGPISNCNDLGLIYGVNVASVAVVFAEICYDIVNMETSFVHIVAGPRSPLLKKQNNLSPSNVTYELNKNQILNFEENDIRQMDSALKRAVRKDFAKFERVAEYDFREILPLKKYSGVFSKFVDSFTSVNLAPWWFTLKSENWKIFEEIVESLASHSSYDIYGGISGAVQFPNFGKCTILENFTYKANLNERSVPLYIWNYVKPRDPKQTGVVVIGVNSPFFKNTVNNSAIFCTDICDTIDWLGPLSNTRQMPALGYVFCCDPQDVGSFLNGFPKLNN